MLIIDSELFCDLLDTSLPLIRGHERKLNCPGGVGGQQRKLSQTGEQEPKKDIQNI